LDRYEAAKEAKVTADLANVENKTLVQADVLKWAAGNGVSGVVAELQSAREQVARYFDFCPYTPNSAELAMGATSLIRS
jgi:predicted nicotinamide N-methyase